jgi:hypothetical protein
VQKARLTKKATEKGKERDDKRKAPRRQMQSKTLYQIKKEINE